MWEGEEGEERENVAYCLSCVDPMLKNTHMKAEEVWEFEETSGEQKGANMNNYTRV